MGTFQLLNFGCRASQSDGAALKKQLLDAGLEEARGLGGSQIAILNTCTVTGAADAEVRQVIRRIHRLNPACRILVTGCYAQRAPGEIAALPGVGWVVGNSHKHLVPELLKEKSRLHGEADVPNSRLSSGGCDHAECSATAENGHGLYQIQRSRQASIAAFSVPPADRSATPDSGPRTWDLPRVLVGEIGGEFHFAPVFPDDRTRPTLKVQDGCNARCSFCVIPAVRGPSRSLVPEKVIEQVRQLASLGYKEIVLSGINLGSYGKDLGRRLDFLGLLERVLAETSMARIRISSIEPMDVTPGLIRLVAHEPRMAQHFHVPLQSGCDRILRLMNRRYWAAQYAERAHGIREAIPNCALGADVMVGFPGETAQDHAASLRFIESLPFTYLHLFPYSARPGTPASARPHQVDGRVAHERSKELRAVIAWKREAYLRDQIGCALSVVVLDEALEGARVALSSNYLKVVLAESGVAPNTLLDARVTAVSGDCLRGFPEPRGDVPASEAREFQRAEGNAGPFA